MSFSPSSGPSVKCSSASATFPGGLPLSFGVILTVTADSFVDGRSLNDRPLRPAGIITRSQDQVACRGVACGSVTASNRGIDTFRPSIGGRGATASDQRRGGNRRCAQPRLGEPICASPL